MNALPRPVAESAAAAAPAGPAANNLNHLVRESREPRRSIVPGPSARVWILLLLLLGLYFALSPDSISMLTINQLAENAAPLALVGLAQMTVLVAGQIDLSVGSVMSLATTIAATQMANTGLSVLAVSVAAIAIGAMLGAFNGLLVARRGLNSFVVTLATWSIISGLALFVLPSAGGATPLAFSSVIEISSPLSFGVYVLLGASIAWLYVRRTGAFIQLKAVGAAADKAAWTGVRRGWVVAAAFALSGAFAAAAGLLLAGETGSGDPTIGVPYILESVAACVIGGVGLFGGRGSVIGVIGGALVLTVVNDVVFALGVTSYVTPAVIGLLLIVAVLVTGIGVREYR